MPSVKEAELMLSNLKDTLEHEVDDLVPWFYKHMPEYYFLTHAEDEQLDHLHAIVSGKVRSERQALTLRSPCGTRVTHIMPGNDTQALLDSVASLAGERIQTARLYSSDDLSLRLDTYLIGAQPLCVTGSKDFDLAVKSLNNAESIVADDFKRFLATASEDYVEKFEAGRAIRHFEMCNCVQDTERVHVFWASEALPGTDRVMVSMANPPCRGVLLAALKIFSREGLMVRRAYGDEFERGDGAILVMSFYLDNSNTKLDKDSETWKRVERQLKNIKWFAFHGLERLAEENGWELGRVMLMQAACEFAHQFLIRTNIYIYTSTSIVRAVLKHRELVDSLARFFETKFDPAFKGDRVEAMELVRAEIKEGLRDVTDDVERKILDYILRFIHHVLRTNYYMPNRFGLSFRMDPRVLPDMEQEEMPYGFYCFHGPSCFGFQVRYRDMARGGVRVVRTRTQEQFEIESNRLLDEVTKLAWAQHNKNKDIPEGGSKAVLLLGPDGEIDIAVKSMVDSLLDLIVTDEEGELPTEIVDYLNREEIIYLGPDENITSKHITWIIERAQKRGYEWAGALMSSKPEVGISHKRYGVTSEGVIVYADEILRTLGIDPLNEPFTVKLTGGPAGDVASNVVKILFREYGDNVHIVVMTDGHGAIFDPDGLDRQELMRLIDNVERTHQFNPALLKGEGAFVLSTDTPEGVRARDDLHNTAVADLFIPSGGRPDTMNIKNWTRFLTADGKPSARAIVEGANIFISADARAKLEEQGVLCVPGPSANKTGVICSSYEILAGLVLSDEEFLEIKDQYVVELLDILRDKARSEARILLREHKLSAGTLTLTDISYQLSRAINALSDTIAVVLAEDVDDLAADQDLCDLLLAYCPRVLAKRYGDRLIHQIPRPHQFALLAAYISSKILYNEGLGWIDPLIKVLDVRQVVRAYLAQEKRVVKLAREVRDSGMEASEVVATILERSGRKVLVVRELGLE